MSTNRIDEDIQDNDPTDELPILTDVIVGQEAEHLAATATVLDRRQGFERRAAKDDESQHASAAADLAAARLQEDLDARDERLSTLEAELARLQQHWSDTEAKLAERDAELERLRGELADRETAAAEQSSALEHGAAELQTHKSTIADLTASLESERDRATALERGTQDLEQKIEELEQKLQELEAERAQAEDESTPDVAESTATRLREEIASLSQHIENRNSIWHEQAATVAAQATRIRELEIEVAQRLERQTAAEKHAETATASANAAREKLRQTLEAERQHEEADADEPREAREEAVAELPAEEDRATQLRRELERTVALQASGQGDEAETLRRLTELEAAIVDLEDQMDAAPRADAASPEPAPEPTPEEPAPAPAQLVCLTGEEPSVYALEQPTVVIGRGASCDIRIKTHYVSREHAKITTTDSDCVIEDLGSRNGVFVNAVKIERQNLEANDLITVGDTQFRYQSSPVA